MWEKIQGSRQRSGAARFVRLACLALFLLAGCQEAFEEPEEAAARSSAATTLRTAEPTTPPAPRTLEPPSHPVTFREAKRLLREFYAARRASTLYSNCPLRGLELDWSRCCVTASTARRAGVEWEHVVPASTFGGQLPEWRSGHTRCAKKGRPFRGRKCARRASKAFASMEGDMHNLFPEIGDVNGARGDTPMGLLDGPSTRHHELSSCALRFGSSVVQPPDEVRGDVARAYLYMSAAYSTAFKLDSSARETFARWHELDPPSDFERERNRWIASKQGNGNPWVE